MRNPKCTDAAQKRFQLNKDFIWSLPQVYLTEPRSDTVSALKCNRLMFSALSGARKIDLRSSSADLDLLSLDGQAEC